MQTCNHSCVVSFASPGLAAINIGKDEYKQHVHRALLACTPTPLFDRNASAGPLATLIVERGERHSGKQMYQNKVLLCKKRNTSGHLEITVLNLSSSHLNLSPPPFIPGATTKKLTPLWGPQLQTEPALSSACSPASSAELGAGRTSEVRVP